MGQTGGMGVPPKGNGRGNSVVQELKMHNYKLLQIHVAKNRHNLINGRKIKLKFEIFFFKNIWNTFVQGWVLDFR